VSTGQDESAAERNSDFFAENQAYSDHVRDLDTYRFIRSAIDAELVGIDRMLDVGNGGVFDYDVTRVREIIAVDLFLDAIDKSAVPANVVMRNGDALALGEPDGTYDAVILAFVLHHLVGKRASDLAVNADRALAEARRVLKPGGRLILPESCVPNWFYPVERALFPAVAAFVRRGGMRHPPTLQLPCSLLTRMVAAHFTVEQVKRIQVGRYLLQFGRKWPTLLSPARPYLIVARAT
jgi:SAM-dependent methyltransferase